MDADGMALRQMEIAAILRIFVAQNLISFAQIHVNNSE